MGYVLHRAQIALENGSFIGGGCANDGRHGVQWLELSPHSEKVLGSNLPANWGLNVWRLHVLHKASMGFFSELRFLLKHKL